MADPKLRDACHQETMPVVICYAPDQSVHAYRLKTKSMDEAVNEYLGEVLSPDQIREILDAKPESPAVDYAQINKRLEAIEARIFEPSELKNA